MGCIQLGGCCGNNSQDFLETDEFEFKRVIHPTPASGNGVILPPITGGTYHGLLYSEHTFNHHPIEINPRIEPDPDKTPQQILAPYFPALALSHRFRKRYITVSIKTPWKSDDPIYLDKGLSPIEAWTMNGAVLFHVPFSERVRVVATNISAGRWEWKSPPLQGTIWALANSSEYDEDPLREYENVFGTKPRGEPCPTRQRAPIRTLAGGQILQKTTPTGFIWGDIRLAGARGFEVGQNIVANNNQEFRMTMDMKEWETEEAGGEAEYQNWYGRNGMFCNIFAEPIYALPGEVAADFLNQNVIFRVTASSAPPQL